MRKILLILCLLFFLPFTAHADSLQKYIKNIDGEVIGEVNLPGWQEFEMAGKPYFYKDNRQIAKVTVDPFTTMEQTQIIQEENTKAIGYRYEEKEGQTKNGIDYILFTIYEADGELSREFYVAKIGQGSFTAQAVSHEVLPQALEIIEGITIYNNPSTAVEEAEETTVPVKEQVKMVRDKIFTPRNSRAALIVLGVLFIIHIFAALLIFRRLGEPVWKVFIPVYHWYISCKYAGGNAVFFQLLAFLLLCPFSFTIAAILTNYGRYLPALIAFPFGVLFLVLFIITKYKQRLFLIRTLGYGSKYFLFYILLAPLAFLGLGFGKPIPKKSKKSNPEDSLTESDKTVSKEEDLEQKKESDTEVLKNQTPKESPLSAEDINESMDEEPVSKEDIKPDAEEAPEESEETDDVSPEEEEIPEEEISEEAMEEDVEETSVIDEEILEDSDIPLKEGEEESMPVQKDVPDEHSEHIKEKGD